MPISIGDLPETTPNHDPRPPALLLAAITTYAREWWDVRYREPSNRRRSCITMSASPIRPWKAKTAPLKRLSRGISGTTFSRGPGSTDPAVPSRRGHQAGCDHLNVTQTRIPPGTPMQSRYLNTDIVRFFRATIDHGQHQRCTAHRTCPGSGPVASTGGPEHFTETRQKSGNHIRLSVDRAEG